MLIVEPYIPFESQPGSSVHVQNLPPHFNEGLLYQIFFGFGFITSIYITRNADFVPMYSFINYKTNEQADLAVT